MEAYLWSSASAAAVWVILLFLCIKKLRASCKERPHIRKVIGTYTLGTNVNCTDWATAYQPRTAARARAFDQNVRWN